MPTSMRSTFPALAAMLLVGPVLAADPPRAPAAAASAPAERRIIEDDNVRIEEVRVRGQTRSVNVQPKGADGKASGRPYQILVAPGGRDAAQERGAAGQRAWSVFSF
jgi:hypothetical protein